MASKAFRKTRSGKKTKDALVLKLKKIVGEPKIHQSLRYSPEKEKWLKRKDAL